jgi:predicted RNA binding protein YcfA (HicA-like mRNA interferase family)
VRFKLEALGFRGISQKGNHAKFIRQDKDGTRTAILPHYTELTAAVAASILRQAGITRDEFDRA